MISRKKNNGKKCNTYLYTSSEQSSQYSSYEYMTDSAVCTGTALVSEDLLLYPALKGISILFKLKVRMQNFKTIEHRDCWNWHPDSHLITHYRFAPYIRAAVFSKKSVKS